jgi:hypothetical protein
VLDSHLLLACHVIGNLSVHVPFAYVRHHPSMADDQQHPGRCPVGNLHRRSNHLPLVGSSCVGSWGTRKMMLMLVHVGILAAHDESFKPSGNHTNS